MKAVTCLCTTHGRVTRLRELLACFLDQDCDIAELVLFNFAPAPLECRYPRVRVINEPMAGTVRAVWARALQHVDTPLVQPWYDDDLCLPWRVRQGVGHVGQAPAWKPSRSWFLQGSRDLLRFALAHPNNDEGALTIQTDEAIRHGLNERNALIIPGTVMTDQGAGASWCFRWADGGWHSSGKADDDPAEHDREWRAANTDFGTGAPLQPLDVSRYWCALIRQHPAAELYFRSPDAGGAPC